MGVIIPVKEQRRINILKSKISIAGCKNMHLNNTRKSINKQFISYMLKKMPVCDVCELAKAVYCDYSVDYIR